MFNFLSLNKCCLTTLVFLAIVSANQIAIAECEDFLDSDFPSDDCSFNSMGVNAQMVKFGYVDEVGDESGSQIPVRFGSSTYNISTSADIRIVLNDDNCFRASDFGIPDLEAVNDFSPIDNVAFIPSSTNPREIERIWVFRCSSVQFQSR